MKIVVATLEGVPVEGDTVMLHYMAPRGGRTTAGHVVALVEEAAGAGLYRKRPESLAEIVAALCQSAEAQYCGSKVGAPAFEPKANGNVLRVGCRDEVQDVTFAAELKGADGGGTNMTMGLTEL